MSTLFGGDGGLDDRHIRARDELASVFRSAQKPYALFCVGIEYERLPVNRRTGRAVPYTAAGGSPSVESFLETMAASRGWRAELESGRIIALERAGTRVTLEPGAQVELSG